MNGTCKHQPIAAILALWALGGTADQVSAAPYAVTGPLVHENLAIYLVHGASSNLATPMTLEDALAKKLVRVIETSNVNALAIENLSDRDVFIQSGDIVTGGKQDRLLVTSLLLPPRSGVLPIAAFCVESGRWSQRAGESERAFAAADSVLSSRSARTIMAQSLASPPSAVAATPEPAGAPQAARQAEMWAEARAMQNDLASSFRARTEDPRSPTSLGLTLGGEQLKARQEEFVKALEVEALHDSDVVGFVAAVDGRILNGEVYATSGLFREMWPKMLRAAAAQALRSDKPSTTERPSVADVEGFLHSAAEGGVTQQRSADNIIETRQARRTLSVATKRADGLLVTVGYVAK